MKAFVFRIFLFLSCLLVALRGAETADILAMIQQADEITLYSLNPNNLRIVDEHGNTFAEEQGRDRFHSYPVLGKIVLPDKSTSARVRSAVVAALNSAPKGDQAGALCFNPRHALCLKTKDRHFDILLCFECLNALVIYREGTSGSRTTILIGPAGETTLNELLDTHRIPRDKPTTTISSP